MREIEKKGEREKREGEQLCCDLVILDSPPPQPNTIETTANAVSEAAEGAADKGEGEEMSTHS